MALIMMMYSCTLLVLLSCVSGGTIEHTFVVQTQLFNRLCKDQYITVVNGSLPGPTIYANEGDTIIVHLINESPYNMTIHWHGVKQTLSCWSDGVAFVTQCPVRPGRKFIYKFNVSSQEGTLWWHAHLGFHRATVYGAIVIYPRLGYSYPFPKPDEEQLIILGEWWNRNVTELQDELDETGIGPTSADANLINGFPGDLYSCSLSTNNRRRFLKNQPTSSLELPEDGSYHEPG